MKLVVSFFCKKCDKLLHVESYYGCAVPREKVDTLKAIVGKEHFCGASPNVSIITATEIVHYDKSIGDTVIYYDYNSRKFGFGDIVRIDYNSSGKSYYVAYPSDKIVLVEFPKFVDFNIFFPDDGDRLVSMEEQLVRNYNSLPYINDKGILCYDQYSHIYIANNSDWKDGVPAHIPKYCFYVEFFSNSYQNFKFKLDDIKRLNFILNDICQFNLGEISDGKSHIDNFNSFHNRWMEKYFNSQVKSK